MNRQNLIRTIGTNYAPSPIPGTNRTGFYRTSYSHKLDRYVQKLFFDAEFKPGERPTVKAALESKTRAELIEIATKLQKP